MAATDQASNYIQFVKIVLKEIVQHKTKVVLCFAVVSFIVLGVGLIYPKTYETTTSVYADQQNIIKPLLAGQAAVTNIQDQARVVREVITSPRILNKVAELAGLVGPNNTPVEIEKVANQLRSSIGIKNIGSNFIKISYAASDPEVVFQVVTNVTNLFIKDMSETKRNESREAYLFIDKQVKSYKAQLQEAEERLKEFKASNLDGTEATVKSRITTLRAQLEEMKLDIDDSSTRSASLEAELAKESQFINKRYKTDVYRERLLAAQRNLDTLLLTYTDDYPDVVALKLQIVDIKKAMNETQEAAAETSKQGNNNSDSNLNPLYEELRSKLAEQKVELRTKQRRYAATEILLEEEFERLKRIATQQAELSELSRDYSVTKDIYEDMLERKEKARLSMTLDVEGQGVNYKIQEPAVYPLTPQGIRFLHFVLVGPILGLIAPIALLVLFVFADPRIRFADKLLEVTQAPLLGVVPHIMTPITQRMRRGDMLMLGAGFLLILIAYAAVVLARLKGYI